MGNATPSFDGDIVQTATPLFAELGYDGTTMDLLASAMGVDVRTAARLAGSKHDLYLTVMRRAYEEEVAALAPAVTGFEASRRGVRELVDRYLDFCLANPRVPALWMHRWLADGADFSHLEELYVRPTHEVLRGLLGDLVAEDVEVEFAIWSIVWSVHGFIGTRARQDQTRNPAANTAKFRRHLHVLAERFLAPGLE